MANVFIPSWAQTEGLPEEENPYGVSRPVVTPQQAVLARLAAEGPSPMATSGEVVYDPGKPRFGGAEDFKGPNPTEQTTTAPTGQYADKKHPPETEEEQRTKRMIGSLIGDAFEGLGNAMAASWSNNPNYMSRRPEGFRNAMTMNAEERANEKRIQDEKPQKAREFEQAELSQRLMREQMSPESQTTQNFQQRYIAAATAAGVDPRQAQQVASTLSVANPSDVSAVEQLERYARDRGLLGERQTFERGENALDRAAAMERARLAAETTLARRRGGGGGGGLASHQNLPDYIEARKAEELASLPAGSQLPDSVVTDIANRATRVWNNTSPKDRAGLFRDIEERSGHASQERYQRQAEEGQRSQRAQIRGWEYDPSVQTSDSEIRKMRADAATMEEFRGNLSQMRRLAREVSAMEATNPRRSQRISDASILNEKIIGGLRKLGDYGAPTGNELERLTGLAPTLNSVNGLLNAMNQYEAIDRVVNGGFQRQMNIYGYTPERRVTIRPVAGGQGRAVPMSQIPKKADGSVDEDALRSQGFVMQ